MLRCLGARAIGIVKSPNKSPYLILYASEVVAHVERLFMEMYSGNQAIVPTMSWRELGVMEGIYGRCWPSFDGRRVDFENCVMNLDCWTMKDEEAIFMQQAAVRFHFSAKVWGLQRGFLERVLISHAPPNSTARHLLQKLVKFCRRCFENGWL